MSAQIPQTIFEKIVYHMNHNKRRGKKSNWSRPSTFLSFPWQRKSIFSVLNQIVSATSQKMWRKWKSKLLQNCCCQLSSFSPLTFIQNLQHLGRSLGIEQRCFQSPRIAPQPWSNKAVWGMNLSYWRYSTLGNKHFLDQRLKLEWVS